MTYTRAQMKAQLILALDFDDQVEAVRVAKAVQSSVGTVKVGLELTSATGPSTIYSLMDLGFQVFMDLKLHDIPTTVYRTCRVLGSLGVHFVTLHTLGGQEMIQSGVEGLFEGAEKGGHRPPLALGITYLTSQPIPDSGALKERLEVALSGGCQGYVAAAADLAITHEVVPQLVSVVTGIRPHGVAIEDHARVSDPSEALLAGADYLVLGRAVTRTPDPGSEASRILNGLIERTKSG